MPHKSKTILIVEDEPIIAMCIEDLVRDLGYSSRTARDVLEAVNIVESGQIDLGILDFTIRDGNSEPVATALRMRSTPFIVCSGSSDAPVFGAFKGAPFLSKPYADAELHQAIASAMT